MEEIKDILAIRNELKEHEIQYSRLSWIQYTVGYDLGLQDIFKKIMEIYKNKAHYDLIRDHLERDLSPDIKRRVELLAKAFEPFHLSPELNELAEAMQKKRTELAHVLNTHRYRLNGREMTRTEISKILRNEPDRDKRRAVFLAQTSVNRPLVEAGFIDLLNLRKEFARLYGADNFASYQLERDELDPTMFDDWPEQVRQALPAMKQIRAEFGEKFLNDPDPKPWDGAYMVAQLAPEMNHPFNMSNFYQPVRDLFAKFGLNPDQYNITYDVFPRRNKSEWGYNFTIEYGKDIRILANIKDAFSDFRVLLHETGHAVHYSNVDPDDPLLNDGISSITAEGIANLFGSMQLEPIFYTGIFNGNLKQARENLENVKRYEHATRLRAVGNILFDQALYKNPIETIDDIHDLKWRIDREVLDEAPYADEPAWGYVIHHTTHPIYLHNYFMGDVCYLMWQQVFCRQQGIDAVSEQPREFGEFVLDNVIKPSGRYTFPELFRRISGGDFSLKYLTAKDEV